MVAETLIWCDPGGVAVETLTLRATRFSRPVLEDSAQRHAASLGLRTWIKTDGGRLRQDLTVTVSGEPAAIQALTDWTQSIPAQAGDAGG